MKKILERMFGGRNKKKLMCIPFLLVAVFLFLPLDHASAGLGTILSMDLSDIVYSGFFLLLEIPWLFCVLLVKISALFVDIFLDPELYEKVLNEYDPADGTGNFAIGAGLATVRDFCYMFYIFFLLLVAFSTVIRSQAYSAKNILPKLVISIFLINFSDVITKVVIDFGQVFLFGMAGWMGNFSGSNGGSAGLTSAVDNLQTIFISKSANGTFSSEDFMILIVSIIFTFMMAFAYLMLAIFLLVRLVMFAFLIVASPIAFFAIVLPSTSSWRKRWQDALWKNVISGPVIIFFIYFSALMMQSLAGFSSTVEVREDINFIGSYLAIIIQAVIPLVILYMAVPAANIVGSTGASAISGGVVSLGKAAGAFGASLPGRGVRKGTAMADAHLKGSNWHGYADKRKKFDGWMGKRGLGVGRAYIELQAKNRSQISEEVKKFEDVFKTMTPDQMADYANSFTIDKEKGARAQQAMINTLMSKGKMDNENLMKAGFVKKDAKGDDIFDAKKFMATTDSIGNYGGDMSDVAKHRLDLIDKKKMVAEFSKAWDKKETGNFKLDMLLDADVAKTMKETMGEEEFEKWRRSKSQGEKDNYLNQRRKMVIDQHNDGRGSNPDKVQRLQDFQLEAALLARADKKAQYMRKAKQNAAGDLELRGLVGPDGKTYNELTFDDKVADAAVATAAVYKFQDTDFAGIQASDLQGDLVDHIPNRGISAINKKGNSAQMDNIRKHYEDKLKTSLSTKSVGDQKKMTDLISDSAKNIKQKAEYKSLVSSDQELVDKMRHIGGLS